MTIDEDGEVWFTVRAFSQQATWYSRIGAPVSALVQRLVTERYPQALPL